MSLCTGVVFAQTPTHPILRGMVADSTRAPIAAAIITAVDTTNRVVFETRTDSEGSFTLQDLSAGTPYFVSVHKQGFIMMTTNVILNQTDTSDFAFMLATDNEVGTMTAIGSPTPFVSPKIRGVVLDSMNAPVAAALVTIADSATKRKIAERRTDNLGRFAFDSVSAEVPYIIIARRIGYLVRTTHAVLLPGYTLDLRFRFAATALLPAVNVTAKKDREYHSITADEIAKSDQFPLDAYDVILLLRPLMLGNAFKGCMEDTSKFTFGPPRPGTDTSDTLGLKMMALRKKMQDPRKATLGIGGYGLGLFKNGGVHLFKRRRDSDDKDGMPVVDSAYPFHLYINGILRGPPGAKNILSQIPVDDIQEMHYVDCMDKDTPQYRNSLMILLKPGKTY